MADTTYGFVGLGNMGAPFAARILGAGQALTVLDAAGSGFTRIYPFIRERAGAGGD